MEVSVFDENLSIFSSNTDFLLKQSTFLNKIINKKIDMKIFAHHQQLTIFKRFTHQIKTYRFGTTSYSTYHNSGHKRVNAALAIVRSAPNGVRPIHTVRHTRLLAVGRERSLGAFACLLSLNTRCNSLVTHCRRRELPLDRPATTREEKNVNSHIPGLLRVAVGPLPFSVCLPSEACGGFLSVFCMRC